MIEEVCASDEDSGSGSDSDWDSFNASNRGWIDNSDEDVELLVEASQSSDDQLKQLVKKYQANRFELMWPYKRVTGAALKEEVERQEVALAQIKAGTATKKELQEIEQLKMKFLDNCVKLKWPTPGFMRTWTSEFLKSEIERQERIIMFETHKKTRAKLGGWKCDCEEEGDIVQLRDCINRQKATLEAYEKKDRNRVTNLEVKKEKGMGLEVFSELGVRFGGFIKGEEEEVARCDACDRELIGTSNRTCGVTCDDCLRAEEDWPRCDRCDQEVPDNRISEQRNSGGVICDDCIKAEEAKPKCISLEERKAEFRATLRKNPPAKKQLLEGRVNTRRSAGNTVSSDPAILRDKLDQVIRQAIESDQYSNNSALLDRDYFEVRAAVFDAYGNVRSGYGAMGHKSKFIIEEAPGLVVELIKKKRDSKKKKKRVPEEEQEKPKAKKKAMCKITDPHLIETYDRFKAIKSREKMEKFTKEKISRMSHPR